MAPRVNMGKSRKSATNVPPVEMIREVIHEIHRHVQKNTDDVGEDFAKEARRYYGEAEERGIRGVASDDEVQELADEEIAVYRLPTLPRNDAISVCRAHGATEVIHRNIPFVDPPGAFQCVEGQARKRNPRKAAPAQRRGHF